MTLSTQIPLRYETTHRLFKTSTEVDIWTDRQRSYQEDSWKEINSEALRTERGNKGSSSIQRLRK